MIIQSHPSQQQPVLFTLSSRPVYFCSLPTNTHLSFALTTHSIQLLSLPKLQSTLLNTNHTKRINMITPYLDHTLLTCSNDGGVKLWDLRQNNKNTVTLKRGYEVYSVTMEGHLLVSGSQGRITFWDLRTNKEMKSYEESFDGDVTDVKLIGDKIYVCATDGMIVCIDINAEIEEDAAEWQHRAGHPAQSMKINGNNISIGTTDHVLIALNQDIEQKKIEINSAEEPRHLLWYEYNSGIFDYMVWNLNDEKVERWYGDNVREVAEGVSDVDFVERVGENVFGVSGEGGVMKLQFGEGKGKEEEKKMELEEGEEQQEIVKTKYGKINKKKMYSPF